MTFYAKFDDSHFSRFPPIINFEVTSWDNENNQPADEDSMIFNALLFSLVKYWEARTQILSGEIQSVNTYHLNYRSTHGEKLHSTFVSEDNKDWTLSVHELAEILYSTYHGHSKLSLEYLEHFYIEMDMSIFIPDVTCKLRLEFTDLYALMAKYHLKTPEQWDDYFKGVCQAIDEKANSKDKG